jgi:hypothetical protein
MKRLDLYHTRRSRGIMTTLLTRAFCLPLILAALACACAAEAAEPIVFIVSYHNLDYAKVACDQVAQSEPEARQTAKSYRQLRLEIDDTTQHILAAGAECRSVHDPRELGRKLENELIDALAVNTRCGGVTVMRDPHPDYDRGSDTLRSASLRS